MMGKEEMRESWHFSQIDPVFYLKEDSLLLKRPIIKYIVINRYHCRVKHLCHDYIGRKIMILTMTDDGG